jgi:hypothetical protein
MERLGREVLRKRKALEKRARKEKINRKIEGERIMSGKEGEKEERRMSERKQGGGG